MLLSCIGFLLDNARNTRRDLDVQQNLNAVLESDQHEMKEQVVSMRDHWKRE